MNNNVVITGLGAISSIGIGKDAFWRNLIAGKNGISEITLFDTSRFKRHRAGEIKNFDPAEFIPKRMAKFFGRASQFAIAGTKLALADAGIPLTELPSRKIAVIIGITMVESNTVDYSSEMFIKNKWSRVGAEKMINMFTPSAARDIGYFFNLTGKNILIPNACAAGNFSLGYGYDLIKREEADLVIAGGAEALSRIAFQGFHRMLAMSPDACAPFDKNRKGMMLGEGSGILVLEPEKTARKRGSRVYAQIPGYGASCDAKHMTIPDKDGIKKAMKNALANAKISSRDIAYVNAHGTGTVANDKNEAQAINEVFGRKVPASSIKSILGHTLGAASAIEAIACCMSIEENTAPPTINFQTPDPECPIDCVPNRARKMRINTALNNSFAFGGNNCCVVFKKYCR